MSGLDEMQECWRQTFGEMRRRHPDILTGPHITVALDGYDPGCIPSVLYVGQAPGRIEPQLEDPLPSVQEFRGKSPIWRTRSFPKITDTRFGASERD